MKVANCTRSVAGTSSFHLFQFANVAFSALSMFVDGAVCLKLTPVGLGQR